MGAESVRAVIRTAGELGIKISHALRFFRGELESPQGRGDTLMKYLAHYMKRSLPN